MNSLSVQVKNRVVERAMDAQVIAHQRIVGDQQELRVLAQLRRKAAIGGDVRSEVEWLWNYNCAEDSDHIEAMRASKDICRGIELGLPTETKKQTARSSQRAVAAR